MSAPRRKNPILTIIAGPNGAGKSTISSGILGVGNLGVLVNADQIATSLAKRKGEHLPSPETQWEAAISAEEMRWALLSQRISFSTETVMSDKVRWTRFITEAKSLGYRIVLYFVTTEDSSINIKRVAERVQAGGHAVPPDKIVSRYRKVMTETIPVILKMVHEAVLLDNSSPEIGPIGVLLLDQRGLSPLVEHQQMPLWAQALLSQF